MKAHRIFTKGQTVYCLLSSFSRPNVLLPIKGLIVDTQWDPINPLYQVRIIKMYDNMKYLKSHFFEMNFKYEFNNRARKMPFIVRRVVGGGEYKIAEHTALRMFGQKSVEVK